MSVGFSYGKSDIDNLAGGLTRAIDQDLIKVQQFAAWLNTMTDASLLALGYVQADVNTLRSAITDLDKLRQIYQGTMYVTNGATPGSGVPTVGNGYVFTTFAKLLSGLNVH
jgi:sulfite exporter TauE/SafE